MTDKTEVQEEVKTTVETIQLTIEDLASAARIIDLATRRGAFQAVELTQVGNAYDKLVKFLAYVEKTQKKEPTEATQVE